jgi:hypothetical protein
MKYYRLLRENYREIEMGKLFFGLLLALTVFACQKDVDIFIPNNHQVVTGEIGRLTTRLKQDLAGEITYTVSCPCFGNAVYEIDKDLVLVVPPGFVNLAEYPCANGSFDIDVTVCDSKGEILIAGIPTITENDLIASRIELNVAIRKGTQHIPLAHGKQLRILVEDPDPIDRMELFYGNSDTWIEADNNANAWDNVTNSEWVIDRDSNDIIQGFGYECFSDSTDWINVDVFYAIPEDQRTDVCVTLPAEFSNVNAKVFLVFRDYNSVTPMHGDPELKQFCEPYGKVPIGFRVTAVVIAEQGVNNYYFAKQDLTVTASTSMELTPLKTPYEEIYNYLKQL